VEAILRYNGWVSQSNLSWLQSEGRMLMSYNIQMRYACTQSKYFMPTALYVR
jgi:hypothetical protein